MFTNSRTALGFPLLTFKDQNDHPCSLQVSSIWLEDDNIAIGGSAVWLGVDDCDPRVMARKLHPNDPSVTGWESCPLTPPPGVKMDDVLFTTRMHLNREQVKTLVKQLNHWLKTSEFIGQEGSE